MRVLLSAAFACVSSVSVAQQPPNCPLGGAIVAADNTVWACRGSGLAAVQVSTGGGEGVPTGASILIDSGTCPTGYTENTALSGKTLIGTTAANKDVGTTGGSDTITPAGTVAAPTFTGSSANTNAVSAGTPAGTNSAPTFTGNAWSAPAIAWPAGVPTFAGTPFTAVINHTHAVTSVGSAATGSTTNLTGASDTSSTTATAANPAGGVASITPAGTVAWPAGVPTIGAYTPGGSVSAPTFTGSALGTHQHTLTATGTNSAPAFTGTQFDNRSAWAKVIVCTKS